MNHRMRQNESVVDEVPVLVPVWWLLWEPKYQYPISTHFFSPLRLRRGSSRAECDWAELSSFFTCNYLSAGTSCPELRLRLRISSPYIVRVYFVCFVCFVCVCFSAPYPALTAIFTNSPTHQLLKMAVRAQFENSNE